MKNPKLALILFIMIIIVSCSKDSSTSISEVLTVTTATPILTSNIAKLGGEVTKDGGKPVTERGICIGESLNPVITDVGNLTRIIGSGLGAFTYDFDISSAPAGIVYHYRAFAKNSDGTVYGENKTITITASACPVINVTANITTFTTWTAGNVYVINAPNNLQVTSKLTIEPGTVIKLNNCYIDVTGGGKIVAEGTATNRIVFTSFADDSICGDSNGDGTASLPNKGDWKELWLNSSEVKSFTYCDFFYGGAARGGENSMINIGPLNQTTVFDNCQFAHALGGSTTSSVTFNADFDYIKSVTTLTNNAFFDNDKPLRLDAKYSVSTTNIFHQPNNSTIKNTRNGIFLNNFNGVPEGTITNWNITEVPYVAAIQFQVSSVGTLNIGPSVKVKFVSPSDYLGAYSGSVNLSPTAILTSYKDDIVGGDTNGDSNTSLPGSGDWKGFSNTVPGATSYYQSANIRYAAN
jgi:hypothetical protein